MEGIKVQAFISKGLSLFLFFTPLLVAAPAMADSVEERIRALEAKQRVSAEELARLKGQQMELQREATEARDALPTFSYRPGRGLTIRGADRSWEFTLSGIFDTRTSFFPDNDAKAINDDDGPSQFAMKLRRLRLGFDFAWEDGLYQAGFTPVWERGSRAGFLGGGMSIDFSKFSPYYPRLDIVSVRPMINRQGSLFSSSAGTSLERPLIEDSILSSGSTEGWGLFWENVPLGPGRIRNFDIVASPGQQFDSKTAVSPLDRKAVMIGFRVQPFSTLKNSLLEGLELGIGYINDRVDDVISNNSHEIETTTRTNRVVVFNADARGTRNWVVPNMGWEHGQYRFGLSWDYVKSEREFSNVGLGKLDDLILREWTVRNGLFIWGPKGFLSGSERGGLMLFYNWFRTDFDAGRDFATRNDFSAMRRYHVVRNTTGLKWFHRPNLIYTLEYNAFDFSQMRGGGDAAEARERLGIGSGGGTSQDITIGIRYNF